MEMNLTPLIEAVLMAIVSIGLPYLLVLLRSRFKLELAETDAAALASVLRRGIAFGMSRAKPGGISVNRPDGIVGDALDYALRLSPDLIRRVTDGDPAKLRQRIEAELSAKPPV